MAFWSPPNFIVLISALTRISVSIIIARLNCCFCGYASSNNEVLNFLCSLCLFIFRVMCLVRITEVLKRGAVYLVDLVEEPAHQVLIPGFKLALVKMVRPGKGWAFGKDKRELCNTMKPQQKGGREGSR